MPRPAYTGGMTTVDAPSVTLPVSALPPLAFIGGGNMAQAMLGGLLRQGLPAARVQVVEPHADTRARLAAQFGLQALAAPGPALAASALVVWAVKPQMFAQAAAECAPHLGDALHLSIMAGVRSDTLVRATGAQRVVRAMPNTPALIGQGIAGLHARDAVDATARAQAEAVLAPTGQTLWVAAEDDLDAVTALSGSGPAYVFLFIEAMIAAATEMGLTPAQGRRLALATFSGASALAAQSDEPPSVLRERVTSKGGTTYAALQSMAGDGVPQAIVRAVRAAQARAAELGRAGS